MTSAVISTKPSNPASRCVALRCVTAPVLNDCNSAVGGIRQVAQTAAEPANESRREPEPAPAQRQASHLRAAIKGRNPIQLGSAWLIRLQWFAAQLEWHLAGSCA